MLGKEAYLTCILQLSARLLPHCTTVVAPLAVAIVRAALRLPHTTTTTPTHPAATNPGAAAQPPTSTSTPTHPPMNPELLQLLLALVEVQSRLGEAVFAAPPLAATPPPPPPPAAARDGGGNKAPTTDTTATTAAAAAAATTTTPVQLLASVLAVLASAGNGYTAAQQVVDGGAVSPLVRLLLAAAAAAPGPPPDSQPSFPVPSTTGSASAAAAGPAGSSTSARSRNHALYCLHTLLVSFPAEGCTEQGVAAGVAEAALAALPLLEPPWVCGALEVLQATAQHPEGAARIIRAGGLETITSGAGHATEDARMRASDLIATLCKHPSSLEHVAQVRCRAG